MQPPSRHASALVRALRDRPYRLGLLWGLRERRRLRGAACFVVFVGHGFSGHSLVGSLLDAHPDAVVSHELDVLRFLRQGLRRQQLLGLIRYRQQTWDGTQNTYSYVVPGQWQGRVRRLTVIGDKKGGGTTWQLADDPSLLQRLRDEIGLPLRVVHVTRNPLDNIGSMVKTMNQRPAEAVAVWRRQAETCTWLHDQLAPEELHVVSTEAVRADPRGRLADLCGFLGLEPEDGYLTACAKLVEPDVSRSRAVVAWPAELLEEVCAVSVANPFLHPYLEELGVIAQAQSWPSSAASASSSVPA